MKTILLYQTTLVLTLAMLSCGTDQHRGITSQDVNVIKSEIVRYEQIIRSNDLEKLVSIFTEDVVFMRPGLDNITGRDNLLKIHYSGVPAVPEFWKSANEIDGHGDVAYTFGNYGFSEGVPAGKFMEIRIKQTDGSWPISRLIWNEISPN